jgi:hypothetical protein
MPIGDAYVIACPKHAIGKNIMPIILTFLCIAFLSRCSARPSLDEFAVAAVGTFLCIMQICNHKMCIFILLSPLYQSEVLLLRTKIKHSLISL